MTHRVVVASRSNTVAIKRKALMISCASAAIAAAALAPQDARAQAFNGTFTNSAAATRSTGTNSETITINPGASGGVTINWTPNNAGTGTIDFLPSGNTATFTNAAGVTDFTVLNRVIPADMTRAIALNGTVLSRIGEVAGGKVWFYTPGGIVVGASAVFDVGGLLLTSIEPTNFGQGGPWTFARGSTVNGPNPAGPVVINSGAQINALQQGSYVALIAPRIEQGGAVRVNGSAAYVAAEGVTMSVNQGLFDIQVDVGTTDGNGVVHSGSTGGPASTGAEDNHRIYMVAVPKNEALTMLLGGTAGFDAAQSAEIRNGAIILSAGSDVFEGSGSLAFTQANSVQSNISIGDGTYSSDLQARADGNIFAFTNEGNINFDGDVTLESFFASGEGRVHVGAINGGDVDIAGNLAMESNLPTLFSDVVLYGNNGGSVHVGGTADLTALRGSGETRAVAAINADGGSVAVDGGVALEAYAQDPFLGEVAADGHGGIINVFASNGGTVSTGAITAHADGVGQGDYYYTGNPANGTGGDILIKASSAGEIKINGAVAATADGIGGFLFNDFEPGSHGGVGHGGNVGIEAEGGTVHVLGSVDFSAAGFGGVYAGEATPTNAVGGNGIGGWTRFTTFAPDRVIDVEGNLVPQHSIVVDGGVSMTADGSGGSGITGGQGIGGDAGMRSYAGTIATVGNLHFSAQGVGGLGSHGGDGGFAQGGTNYIQAQLTNGPSARISGGNVDMHVTAFGGTGGNGNGDNIEAGAGGDAQGGFFNGQEGSGGAFVIADNRGAELNFGDISLDASGWGGTGGAGLNGQSGGAGGNAIGGTANAGTYRPIMENFTALASVAFGEVDLNASATGGDGGFGGEGGQRGAGGNAFGGGHCLVESTCGGALLSARGTVSFGSAHIMAEANGGFGSTGGNAKGGDAEALAAGAGSLTGTGSLWLSASGHGGDGDVGGAGEGNNAVFAALTGGVASIGGNVDVFADGHGGFGQVTGGAGVGGDSLVWSQTGSSLHSDGDVFARARGLGGDAAEAGTGTGGSAQGGTADLNVEGTFSAGSYTAYARGFGGDSPNGTGGAAVGGTGTIAISGSADFVTDLVLTTYAQGGNGIVGGNATAASASLDVSGHVTAGGLVEAASQASGGFGSGGLNGSGTGGIATFTVTGSLEAADIFVAASGEFGNFEPDQGGEAHLVTSGIGSIVADTIEVDAMGDGGFAEVSEGGNIDANSLLTVQSGGGIDISDLFILGDVELDAGGNILLGNLDARSLDFQTDGSMIGGNISVVNEAGGDAQGAILLGNITAGLPSDSDASVGMSSATSITVGNVSGLGPVGFATLGNLTAGNITAGDFFLLMVGGDINLGSITTAAGGRVYLADVSMFIDAGGGGEECNCDGGDEFDPATVLALAPVATGGSIVIGGAVTTGRMQAAAGTDLTVGDVTASDSVELAAGGVASFLGLVSAPEITVASGDINIADGASLGEAGVTDVINLIAVSDSPVIIGSTGAAAAAEAGPLQYVLDEDGDIAADTVNVTARTAGEGADPDIVVHNVRIEGSQTEGGGVGHVSIATEGSVIVDGLVDFINAAAGDRLTITAGKAIQLITDTGGISMKDSTGHLSGILQLASQDVWAARRTLIDQLRADTNFAGRDAALATNTGPVNPAGYLQAGGVQLLAGKNIFIQNTGTATEFAGLTVGGQGLLIGRYQAVTNPDGTQGFSFTGTLATANTVLQFDFTITAQSDITLRTYSYAGGTNAAGQAIPSGGFDPILALFDAAGALIGQNDDGGSNVPADPTTGSHYDTFLQRALAAGNYTVTVTAYSNFAVGPNLSNGFTGGGSFNGRTANFAFDVLGADTATGPGAAEPIRVVAFGRAQNSDGSFVTGADFFNQV
ncbi:MAG: DVUA0089 family protein, partial [Sphingomicrobium sp.]